MPDWTVPSFDPHPFKSCFQEKIKRIQQIRTEKELRAQRILEVCPKKFSAERRLKHSIDGFKNMTQPTSIPHLVF